MGYGLSRRQFLGGVLASGCLTSIARGYPGARYSSLPTGANEKLDELYDVEKKGIKSIAFMRDDGWLMLYGRNGYVMNGAPGSLSTKVRELNAANHEIKKVVCSPDGGWLVFFEETKAIETWSAYNMPTGLTNALTRCSKEFSTIKHVAFTHDGGWIVLYGYNGFEAQNVPKSALDKLRTLRGEGACLKHIAFTKDSGWAILNGSSGWNTHDCPSGANDDLKELYDKDRHILSIEFTPDDGYCILNTSSENADTKTWKLGDDDDPIPPWRVTVHDFPNGYQEESVMFGSMKLLRNRFYDRRVIADTYAVGHGAYYIQDAYWDACNVTRHPTYGPLELLKYQLETLSLPRSAQDDDDEGPPMPEIHLYAYNEASNVRGFARWANSVLVKYVRDGLVRRTGDFRVHVNTYALGVGVGDHGSGLNYWACVIGHEMLHNLGHAHDVNDYGDNRQINCFHRAIYFNGTYNGNRNSPQVICGCKPPI